MISTRGHADYRIGQHWLQISLETTQGQPCPSSPGHKSCGDIYELDLRRDIFRTGATRGCWRSKDIRHLGLGVAQVVSQRLNGAGWERGLLSHCVAFRTPRGLGLRADFDLLPEGCVGTLCWCNFLQAGWVSVAAAAVDCGDSA